MNGLGGFAGGLAQGFASTWKPELVEKARANAKAEKQRDEKLAADMAKAKADATNKANEITQKANADAQKAYQTATKNFTDTVIKNPEASVNYWNSVSNNAGFNEQKALIGSGDSKYILDFKSEDLGTVDTIVKDISTYNGNGLYRITNAGVIETRESDASNDWSNTGIRATDVRMYGDDKEKVESNIAYSVKGNVPKAFGTKEEYNKAINSGLYTDKDARELNKGKGGLQGEYFYNIKKQTYDFFNKGEDVPEGYIPKSQVGNYLKSNGDQNDGVKRAKTKLSSDRLVSMQTEEGVNAVKEEYSQALSKDKGLWIDAEIPNELVDIIVQTEINMANNNPEAHGDFSLMTPDQKYSKIKEALGNPEIQSSLLRRLTPWVDDVVLKKVKDGKITEVTGSIGDQVDVPLPMHIKVLLDVMGKLTGAEDKLKGKK